MPYQYPAPPDEKCGLNAIGARILRVVLSTNMPAERPRNQSLSQIWVTSTGVYGFSSPVAPFTSSLLFMQVVGA
jgi:hypothetical protein